MLFYYFKSIPMDIKKKTSFWRFYNEKLEEDIWVMSLSERITELQQEKVDAEAAIEEERKEQIAEEVAQPTVEEVVADPVIGPDEEPKTIDEVQDELKVEDEKEEVMEPVKEAIDKAESDLKEAKKSPEETVTELAETFYWMYDEQATKLSRMTIAYDKLTKAYEWLAAEHEELKFQVKRTWDVDDDVRYLSKLKKWDESSKEEYQQKILKEVADYYETTPQEIERDLKEKRARMAWALWGTVAWTTPEPAKEEKKEEYQWSWFDIKK